MADVRCNPFSYCARRPSSVCGPCDYPSHDKNVAQLAVGRFGHDAPAFVTLGAALAFGRSRPLREPAGVAPGSAELRRSATDRARSQQCRGCLRRLRRSTGRPATQAPHRCLGHHLRHVRPAGPTDDAGPVPARLPVSRSQEPIRSRSRSRTPTPVHRSCGPPVPTPSRSSPRLLGTRRCAGG